MPDVKSSAQHSKLKKNQNTDKTTLVSSSNDGNVGGATGSKSVASSSVKAAPETRFRLLKRGLNLANPRQLIPIQRRRSSNGASTNSSTFDDDLGESFSTMSPFVALRRTLTMGRRMSGDHVATTAAQRRRMSNEGKGGRRMSNENGGTRQQRKRLSNEAGRTLSNSGDEREEDQKRVKQGRRWSGGFVSRRMSGTGTNNSNGYTSTSPRKKTPLPRKGTPVPERKQHTSGLAAVLPPSPLTSDLLSTATTATIIAPPPPLEVSTPDATSTTQATTAPQNSSKNASKDADEDLSEASLDWDAIPPSHQYRPAIIRHAATLSHFSDGALMYGNVPEEDGYAIMAADMDGGITNAKTESTLRKSKKRVGFAPCSGDEEGAVTREIRLSPRDLKNAFARIPQFGYSVSKQQIRRVYPWDSSASEKSSERGTEFGDDDVDETVSLPSPNRWKQSPCCSSRSVSSRSSRSSSPRTPNCKHNGSSASTALAGNLLEDRYRRQVAEEDEDNLVFASTHSRRVSDPDQFVSTHSRRVSDPDQFVSTHSRRLSNPEDCNNPKPRVRQGLLLSSNTLSRRLSNQEEYTSVHSRRSSENSENIYSSAHSRRLSNNDDYAAVYSRRLSNSQAYNDPQYGGSRFSSRQENQYGYPTSRRISLDEAGTDDDDEFASDDLMPSDPQPSVSSSTSQEDYEGMIANLQEERQPTLWKNKNALPGLLPSSLSSSMSSLSFMYDKYCMTEPPCVAEKAYLLRTSTADPQRRLRMPRSRSMPTAYDMERIQAPLPGAPPFASQSPKTPSPTRTSPISNGSTPHSKYRSMSATGAFSSTTTTRTSVTSCNAPVSRGRENHLLAPMTPQPAKLSMASLLEKNRLSKTPNPSSTVIKSKSLAEFLSNVRTVDATEGVGEPEPSFPPWSAGNVLSTPKTSPKQRQLQVQQAPKKSKEGVSRTQLATIPQSPPTPRQDTVPRTPGGPTISLSSNYATPKSSTLSSPTRSEFMTPHSPRKSPYPTTFSPANSLMEAAALTSAVNSATAVCLSLLGDDATADEVVVAAAAAAKAVREQRAKKAAILEQEMRRQEEEQQEYVVLVPQDEDIYAAYRHVDDRLDLEQDEEPEGFEAVVRAFVQNWTGRDFVQISFLVFTIMQGYKLFANDRYMEHNEYPINIQQPNTMKAQTSAPSPPSTVTSTSKLSYPRVEHLLSKDEARLMCAVNEKVCRLNDVDEGTKVLDIPELRMECGLDEDEAFVCPVPEEVAGGFLGRNHPDMIMDDVDILMRKPVFHSLYKRGGARPHQLRSWHHGTEIDDLPVIERGLENVKMVDVEALELELYTIQEE